MIIELSPDDVLTVRFKDTDGEFQIHFDSEKHPETVTVEETSNFPDDKNRTGILYQESFEKPNTGGCHICGEDH